MNKKWNITITCDVNETTKKWDFMIICDVNITTNRIIEDQNGINWECYLIKAKYDKETDKYKCFYKKY